ncbi:MAG: TonB-dependent receptor plug domain-containing protein [Ignavibacteriales bacterium]|nr:TonB-dependent receptor plug domain-containing protein [Ignavibacteriales bacterium]
MTRCSFLVLIMVQLLGAPAIAGIQDTSSAQTDTTALDSVRITFIPAMGKITDQPDSAEFSAGRFLWTDAIFPGELFRLTPGFFLGELSSPGLPVNVSRGGVDWRGVSLLLDGRQLTDPVTGVHNVYNIPLEFIDHLELITGPSSFMNGANGSTTTINVVSRQYNTGRPVTKIRFLQGPYEHLLPDALFTQNIVRKLNLLIGVQRHTSDDRYVNSRYDSWNVRTRLRFNASERLNLSLTDLYHRSVTGINNGVDLDTTRSLGLDVFNEAEALVLTPGASETISRRDLTLSAIARVFDDSSSTTQAHLYYSTADRTYHDPSGTTSDAFDSYGWNVYGGSLRQNIGFGLARSTLGGSYERHEANPASKFVRPRKTVSAWYGETKFGSNVLVPAVFARGERNDKAQAFSYGAKFSALVDGAQMSVGFSESHRFPSLQELNWPTYLVTSGSIDLKERHSVVEISAAFSPSPLFELSAAVSRRAIRNALQFTSLQPGAKFPAIAVEVSPEVTVQQVSGTLTLRLWRLEGRGGLTYTQIKRGSAITSFHPRLVLTGELYYRDSFFREALDARFGLLSRYVTRHDGTRYVPSLTVFAENSQSQLRSFSTVDLFGVFRIGDALIYLTWQNPLGREFFTVYGYPALGRNVKIGLNWVFLD